MYTQPRLILFAFACQGDGCVSVCARVNRASDQLAVVVFSHGRSQKVLITTRTKSMSELIPYVCAMPYSDFRVVSQYALGAWLRLGPSGKTHGCD